jgi:hypothetical protein
MGNLGLDAAEPFTNLPPQTPGALSERAPPTPWHDDYEMAPSVGPVSSQSNHFPSMKPLNYIANFHYK